MPTVTHRRAERRVSVRVTLSIPVRVDGRTVTGEEFTMRTHTSSVSELGCLVLLDKDVAVEDTIVLMNEHTRQSIFCTVISQRRHRDGKRYVGAGFLSPKPNFWGIVFSKPGARSLKRQYDSGRQK